MVGDEGKERNEERGTMELRLSLSHLYQVIVKNN